LLLVKLDYIATGEVRLKPCEIFRTTRLMAYNVHYCFKHVSTIRKVCLDYLDLMTLMSYLNGVPYDLGSPVALLNY